MIAHVSGVVAEKFINSLIVDVGGVGYEVFVSALDFEAAHLHEPIKLYTHHQVREQEQSLFGFSSLAAKRLFELLTSVQGIGPKAALAILSLAPSEQVRSAIANGDAGFIQKASGVGKRGADRVVVDLQDKVGLPSGSYEVFKPQQLTALPTDDAMEALMALGFNLAQATEALQGIDDTLPTEERVRLALKG
ncbi:Holliday junction branch migration protein RuvA [Candidatus Saccharibacteria bacterium]|nr:Holliday junction branch migration protein RuvA [Candidatus Saccharibacteria bacterium]